MKLRYIELLGNKYPLCFSLSATEELCDIFGDLDGMSKALTDKNTGKQIKAINAVLEILIRAGQNYCKVAGIDTPPPLDCKPGDVMDISDPEAIKAIFEAISGDNEREVEATPKNAKPTQE